MGLAMQRRASDQVHVLTGALGIDAVRVGAAGARLSGHECAAACSPAGRRRRTASRRRGGGSVVAVVAVRGGGRGRGRGRGRHRPEVVAVSSGLSLGTAAPGHQGEAAEPEQHRGDHRAVVLMRRP